MPHTTTWYIEKRIIYMNIYGDITLDEATLINDDFNRYLDAGTAPIHILVNDTQVGKMPFNVKQLRSRLTCMSHPNIGLLVSIGEVNPILNYIMPMIAKIAGLIFIRRKTVADSLDYLSKHDATLNWEEANDAVLIQSETFPTGE